MNTKRQPADHFRGAHVHLHLTTASRDFTTLANTVLRGQFTRPDGQPVRLKAGPRSALLALLSFGMEGAEDPAWRLDMDLFVADFVESKDTVYGWIRTLAAEGFVTRERVNDPATGHFEWHMDVSDRPAAVATVTDMNPQVAPIQGFPRDGAAPPVDNSGNRRSHHPMENPGWGKPPVVNPHTATSYRETKDNYLPASPPVSDARENDQAEEGAGTAFAIAGQPRLIKPASATTRTADEENLAPHDRWLNFIATLTNAQECQGKLQPTRQAQELLAIRAQVAHEQCGWEDDQLRRLLLGGLKGAEHLAGIWAHRLHPENLPVRPGLPLAPGTERAGDVPASSPTRIAEIRQLHGQPRGTVWSKRMGGSAG
jgi:hypothetical protein